MRKLREKIENYLSSPDKDMRKLGQKLCHVHRIDYYVATDYLHGILSSMTGARQRVVKLSLKKPNIYSTVDIEGRGRFDYRKYYAVHKINLNGKKTDKKQD